MIGRQLSPCRSPGGEVVRCHAAGLDRAAYLNRRSRGREGRHQLGHIRSSRNDDRNRMGTFVDHPRSRRAGKAVGRDRLGGTGPLGIQGGIRYEGVSRAIGISGTRAIGKGVPAAEREARACISVGRQGRRDVGSLRTHRACPKVGVEGHGVIDLRPLRI